MRRNTAWIWVVLLIATGLCWWTDNPFPALLILPAYVVAYGRIRTRHRPRPLPALVVTEVAQ